MWLIQVSGTTIASRPKIRQAIPTNTRAPADGYETPAVPDKSGQAMPVSPPDVGIVPSLGLFVENVHGTWWLQTGMNCI